MHHMCLCVCLFHCVCFIRLVLCVDFRAGEPLFKLLLVCGCYELCPDPELRGEDSCGRKNILVSAHPQSVCVCVCVCGGV